METVYQAAKIASLIGFLAVMWLRVGSRMAASNRAQTFLLVLGLLLFLTFGSLMHH